MTRYGMAIDTKRCFSCNKCSMACKVEHNLPEDVLWSRAHTEGGDYYLTPSGTYPNDLHMGFYTLACQHCAEPACFEVCPTGATSVRDDGIVVVNYEECIGCKSCIEACPYEGFVPLSKTRPTLWTGKSATRRHPTFKTERCQSAPSASSALTAAKYPSASRCVTCVPARLAT